MGQEARLRFRADACLPRRFPGFACQGCADACPSGALIPTAAGPRLASGCTDCGQCVTRCPTEALAVPGFGPARLPAANNATAPVTLDCWRVALERTPAHGLRVPCLGGLSPAWLLELVADAAGRPVHLLDRGLCGACPAGPAASDAARLSIGHVAGRSGENAHLPHPARWCLDETARLLDGIELDQDRWPRLIPAFGSDGASAGACSAEGADAQVAKLAESKNLRRPEPLLEARLSRRAFFTGRTGRRADPPAPRRHEQAPRQDQVARQGQVSRQDQAPPVSQGTGSDWRPRLLPEQPRRLAALLRLAPAQRVPARLFPALAITEACAHHGLCASACPNGALSRYRREGEQGHRFNPSDCSACGLCVQLCPEQAIRLRPRDTQDRDNGALATAAQTLTRFSTHACSACGAEIPVAVTSEAAGESPLCPACARDQDFARSAFQTLFAARHADA